MDMLQIVLKIGTNFSFVQRKLLFFTAGNTAAENGARLLSENVEKQFRSTRKYCIYRVV